MNGQDELLDLVEVTDEELEDFLGTFFGPSREDDTDLTGTRRSNEPTISYKKVINLYVKISDDTFLPVPECPAEAFSTLVQDAAATAPNPVAAARAIDGLDYAGTYHLINKWFAIDELLAAGAVVPLFSASKELVTLSHGPRRPGRSHEDLLSSEASSRGTGYQGIDPCVEYRLALPSRL